MNTIPKPAERFPFPTSPFSTVPTSVLATASKGTLPPKRHVPYGCLRGQIRISDDFDAPLPEDLLARFEGRV